MSIKIYAVSVALLIWCTSLLQAQETDKKTAPLLKAQPSSFYREARSYSTKRESDPPAYVRNAARLWQNEKLHWLDLGLDFRSRGELRHYDLRRPVLCNDYPLLLRTRAYLGIRHSLDPLRAVVEFEDAWVAHAQFPAENRDVNRAEIIQSFVELYFANWLPSDAGGNARPIQLRFGRQAFEFLDRRLIGSNLWRNTTNNFLGFRAAIGQDANNWQLDLLAVRPINRLVYDFDQHDPHRDFVAAIFHWRQWSQWITLEPFFMGLYQRPAEANNQRARQIHSPGLRVYGFLLHGTVDYDLSATYQWGRDNGQAHQAYALTAEIGFQPASWSGKPRFSAFYGYITGDLSPTDNSNQRFERLFGFARPWGADDYISPENIVAPKLKVEFELLKRFKIDGGYNFYWLASSTDRFPNMLAGENNRDRSGQSGTFIGHGPDARVRYSPTRSLQASIGYAHLTNGEFVLNRQQAALKTSTKGSDFLYLELSFNVWDLFL